jgi:orotate phosphoribosyltransferase
MKEEEIIEIFKKTGAFLDGHFVLASANHTEKYINKDAVYPHTTDVSKLGLKIAKKFVDDEIEVVIGPEKGGIILSQWVAYHLTALFGREVLSVYAEKIVTHIDSKDKDFDFEVNRNYDKLIKGKKVLVVEDILTTGCSAKKVVNLVRSIGGIVVGLGALCNRGKVTASDIGGIPKLFALLDVKLDVWSPTECPLCKRGIPMNTNVGKGKEFLEQRGK